LENCDLIYSKCTLKNLINLVWDSQLSYISQKFITSDMIYSPTKVKHHLTCFNNSFSNNELISNRFVVFVTCTHILTYLWNRLLIDFYLCVYDRVCKVPRVFFNICVCERKLIFLCVEF
jgi:small basic protein